MKYIKPETTITKLELSSFIMGSNNKEYGIVNPGDEKGTDAGGGNIGMGKHDEVSFDASDDNGWSSIGW